MALFQQILFLFVLLATAFLVGRRVKRIRNNILLGKSINRSDDPGKRWKRVLLIAFGQKKMFKRLLPAFLHLIIYTGFLVVNIEIIEFILDGITGKHRVIAVLLNEIGWGSVYTVFINVFEFYALGIILASMVFLARRNALRIRRFDGPEMVSWPKLDANLILIFEIILMAAILTMNATDQILQVRNPEVYPFTGRLMISDLLATPFYQFVATPNLIAVERLAWWLHIIGILGFGLYVTYSKHLHIILAFPNVYFSNLEEPGKIPNMPEVAAEVKMMLGLASDEGTATPGDQIPRLGARDVEDLTWKNLMDAYTCTECGRCTSVCPANDTGKKLSPRKIMMDTRDRLEEVGKRQNENGQNEGDGKSLLGDYITTEELYACTSCNACSEACPVMIDPLSIILQMRRYLAMEESKSPAQWNAMFSNIESSFSPWKFAPSDRFKWADDLGKGETSSQS